jgi:selenide,water dikinase
MAAASGCSIEIEATRVPLLDGVRELVRGNIPGGGRTNREHFGPAVRVAAGVDDIVLDLLYDPQTSGGLLIAVAPADGDRLLADLVRALVPAVRIGRAVSITEARIVVS